MQNETNTRQMRGQMIAKLENQITRVFDFEYLVNSQSKEGTQYRVIKTTNGWACACPDYVNRKIACKHIYGVQFSLELREEVKRSIVLEPISNLSQCQFCGSTKLRKYGIRKNKSGDIQRFLCEMCKRTFSVNIGFQHMRHNPQAITMAIENYFRGLSLRNTQKSLRNIGVKVSHKTIFYWIRKYVDLMNYYAEKIQPTVSDTWRTDELHLRIGGQRNWLFAIMDNETRFWIAQQVARHKGVSDISPIPEPS